MATKTNGWTEGCARKNTSPSTQRTNFGLSDVKTYDNAESRARHKENYWEATDGDAEGCNQEGTLARSGQTPV